MKNSIFGNSEGWYQAWTWLLGMIQKVNFTPLAPVVIIYIIVCSLILWGCWSVWSVYLRRPKKAAETGGQ